MKVLFARVGYMKYYQGPQKGDEKPIGGGKHNKNKIGHEAYNFKEVNGKLYGYFRPHMKSPYEINLKRIDPDSIDEFVDDVLVIFFSKIPEGKGQVIVGWYRDATVCKTAHNPTDQKGRDNFGYNMVANKNDETLLPISKRKYIVGHGIKRKREGNPGQANVFYIYDDKFKKKPEDEFNSWIYKAIDYVNNYKGAKIESFEDEVQEEIKKLIFLGSGQGFQANAEIRKLIETYAMNRCRKHYEKEGYKVTDTSLKKPYDFRAKKGRKKLFIEVKGTQDSGEKIILTKNEVELSVSRNEKRVLFLVHSIQLNKESIKKNSGVVVIKSPWEINEKKLTVISYTYLLS